MAESDKMAEEREPAGTENPGTAADPQNEDDADEAEVAGAAPPADGASARKPPPTSALRYAFYALFLVALVTTCFLVIDYTQAVPVFCGEVKTGCGAVRQSPLARPLGIPMPIIGLVALGGLFALFLRQGAAARKLFRNAALVATLGGIGLLVAQAVLGHFCKFCLVVDGSVILIGILSTERFSKGWDVPGEGWQRFGLFGMYGFFVSLALLFGVNRKPDAPAPILAEMEKTPGDKVCIVDFVDLECPFCRETHKALKPILEKHKNDIRYVRKHVPLGRIHPHAEDAARATLCAEKQDEAKGDAFAEAVMALDPLDMIPFAYEGIARKVELDMEVYRACFKDRAPLDVRLAADRKDYDIAAGQGLPTMYMDAQKLFGAQQQPELEAAFERALKGKH